MNMEIIENWNTCLIKVRVHVTDLKFTVDLLQTCHVLS